MVSSVSLRGGRDSGADAGKLVLRLALGVLILLHGIAKLSGPPTFVMSQLGNAGLPTWVAYGVYVGEIVAPLLLIVGVWTRAAALVIAVNMLFAVALVHRPELLQIGKQGGYALELQAMFLFAAVGLAFLGAGRFSLGGRYGRLN